VDTVIPVTESWWVGDLEEAHALLTGGILLAPRGHADHALVGREDQLAAHVLRGRGGKEEDGRGEGAG